MKLLKRVEHVESVHIHNGRVDTELISVQYDLRNCVIGFGNDYGLKNATRMKHLAKELNSLQH